MKKTLIRILAVALVLSLLLTGCNSYRFDSWMHQLGSFLGMSFVTTFSEMEYTRPNLTEIQEKLDACVTSATEETSADKLMEQVWAFYTLYNDFYTNYYLSDIHYCKDTTDLYWTEEYNYCMDSSATVDAALDKLYHALADSPLRPDLEEKGYFAPGELEQYEGESIWTEELIGLMEQESQLVSRYYDLTAEASAVPYYSEEYFTVYGTQMLDIFAELVLLRQRIATSAGYGDYPTFAYEQNFLRDYTPEQAQTYFSDIQAHLVPLYREMDVTGIISGISGICKTDDTFFYVKSCAKKLGGGFDEAFRLMEAGSLYDISYSENKYPVSFEVFLPGYMEPYLFVCPNMTQDDKLSFAHEFGHFCNDYASGGTMADVDVAEIFSQSMENLSLLYADGGDALTRYRMFTVLSTYVEQAAYASFEYSAYMLPPGEVTPENILALYEKTGTEFGFDSWDWDPRDLVAITHFYMVPMYISSYVLSNDAALQIYQLEMEESGAGAALLEQQLNTQESYFLAFLEAAGLESPFAEGRMEAVYSTLRAALQ